MKNNAEKMGVPYLYSMCRSNRFVHVNRPINIV